MHVKYFLYIDYQKKKWYNNIVDLFMEVNNMSIEKQKLYNEIETLPDELTNQVINFIEYLKLSYIDTETPESVTIKSKKDLKEKLQKGLDDVKENRMKSLDETFAKIDNI